MEEMNLDRFSRKLYNEANGGVEGVSMEPLDEVDHTLCESYALSKNYAFADFLWDYQSIC